MAQGYEDLGALPANSASSYLSRSWIGTDGVTWSANSARTDRTLNGKAICFGTTGDRRITSPVYSGGIGTLSFSYVRDFTGTANRSLEIRVNGQPASAPIVVDPLSDLVAQFQQDINIEGDVSIEIRSTGAGQVKLDDISWTAFTPVPTVSFTSTALQVNENSASVPITLSFTQPVATDATLTLGVNNGPGVIPGSDHTWIPAPVNGTITLNIPAGSATASLDLDVIDDAIGEAAELIGLTLLASTGGLQIGTPASLTITIQDNDVAGGPAILSPGDLVIVGVNANDQACGGSNGEDVLSFFSFRPITNGTTIILTDNGFQRCNTGLWGNSEGTVQLQRTGGTIPAGQVITFRLMNIFGPGNVVPVAPDNAWSCSSLNGNTMVNLNAGGDQLFIMQGGTWTTGTIGAHNASYSGTVLFGFTSNPAYPWSASCSNAASQRSDLPSGIECFSMAPTLATDFNKYSGPITEASQRNWIIRLDEPSNWSSYAGCAAYAGQGYDWGASPIMPIGSASFEAGRWTGAISTDWFECKNWDDARIPTQTTDVVIDQQAVRHCVVGLSTGLQPAGTGHCASLNLINSGTSRNLSIAANSALDVGGPIAIERTAGTGDLSITVAAGATLSGTGILLNSVGAMEAAMVTSDATSSILIEGGITIGAGGRLDMAQGGSLSVGGNWNNFGSQAHFVEGSGRVILNGNSDQNIFTTDPQEIFHDMVIGKSGGNVELASPVVVNGTLDLTSGKILTFPDRILILGAGSSAINASDASFVNGPLQKKGNSDFIFPIGKAGSLRPCALSAIQGAIPSFTAEYFNADPTIDLGSALQPGLDHISQCEHWSIQSGNATASALVELSWDSPESCGITDLSTLRTARWNGTQWLDRGNGGVTGDLQSGTISTASLQDVLGSFTLASIDVSNPLPITLISFTGSNVEEGVMLQWSTASEMNSDHFTIERSENGTDFLDLVTVESAGNSTSIREYAAMDREPHAGLNYYRLRQADHDGTSTTSAVITVLVPADRSLTVISSPTSITAYHDLDAGSNFELFDVSGSIILNGISDRDGATMIAGTALESGVYLLRVSDGVRSESVRFIHDPLDHR